MVSHDRRDFKLFDPPLVVLEGGRITQRGRRAGAGTGSGVRLRARVCGQLTEYTLGAWDGILEKIRHVFAAE